jgi:hypothetical protein
MEDTAYACSTAAQYAALGRMNIERIPAPAPPRSEPVRMSGLEALGRYVGSSNAHPYIATDTDDKEDQARAA